MVWRARDAKGGWTGLLLAAAFGCGSASAPEPTPTSTSVSGTATGSEPAAPATPLSPAPVLRLAWLPDGRLLLENEADERTSLQRTISVRGAPELPELTLNVTCAAPPASDGCVSLVPGAAVAMGSWPDDLGACRCPPCAAEVTATATSIVARSCDAQHELTLELPPR